jgi:hypothetical protein
MRQSHLFYLAFLATVVVCVPIKTRLETRIKNGLASTPPMGFVYYSLCEFIKKYLEANKWFLDGIHITTIAATRMKPS